MSAKKELTLQLVEKIRWWAARHEQSTEELAAFFGVPWRWVKYARAALPADLGQLSVARRAELSENHLAAVARSREYIARELGGVVPLPSTYDSTTERPVLAERRFLVAPTTVRAWGRMGHGNRRILAKCPSDQLGGSGIWWSGLIPGDRGSFT